VPRVHVGSVLRALVGGESAVDAEGATLREVIADLDRRFPGVGERLIDAGGIRPEVMIAIGADETRDPDAPVAPDAEIHLLPAIAGG
jgi:molybdopterin converting factor small subunit